MCRARGVRDKDVAARIQAEPCSSEATICSNQSFGVDRKPRDQINLASSLSANPHPVPHCKGAALLRSRFTPHLVMNRHHKQRSSSHQQRYKQIESEADPAGCRQTGRQGGSLR